MMVVQDNAREELELEADMPWCLALVVADMSPAGPRLALLLSAVEAE
jgi:hypothetical protein